MKAISFCFLLILISSGQGLAQVQKEFVVDSLKPLQIKLNDKSVLQGEIVRTDSLNVVIRTKSTGNLTVLKTNIISVESLSKEKLQFDNPVATRYFVGPSAIPLKKGEGYYQNTYLFIHAANYGITKHISIGGGFELLSFVIRSNNSRFNFFLTPKMAWQTRNKNIFLGIGALHINTQQASPGYSTINEKYRQNFNIFYGSATIGNREHNLTFSTGFIYRNYTLFNFEEIPQYDSFGNYTGSITKVTEERTSVLNPNPIFTISGMTRIGKRFSLITENWIVPEGASYRGYFSFGFRILGENTGWDFGFINNGDIKHDIRIGIPYINFTAKF